MASWTWFLSLLCSVWISPTYAQRAKPGDFPWRFRLVVSNDSELFHGVLKFDIYFDSKSDHHQSLLLQAHQYEPGSVISSLQKLNEGGMVDTVAKIEASVLGDPRNCSLESITIKELALTSFHKKRTFVRIFHNDDLLILSPPCAINASNASHHSNSSSVTIDNFKPLSSQDCYYHGEIYEPNQSFDIGCEMQCRCKDGMVDCDSMCKPPSGPLPRNCRMASIDRKCCDETECMEDALWDSCPVHTAARDRMPPWAVQLAVQYGRNQSEERTCGASIIHKRLLITSASCVRSNLFGTEPLDNLGSVSVVHTSSNASIARVKSIQIHPAYNGKDASADLALVELANEGVVFGDLIKRVNLPWPTLCKRYVSSGCAVQYTTVDGYDSYVGSVVPSSKFCLSAPSPLEQKPFGKSESKNGTEAVICVQRTTDGLTSDKTSKKCNQETGNSVVTKRAQYHYIIGVVAHEYKGKPDIGSPKVEAVIDQIRDSRPSINVRTRREDQASSSISQQGNKVEGIADEDWRSCSRQYVPVTNLCAHIDWLKNTINELLARE